MLKLRSFGSSQHRKSATPWVTFRKSSCDTLSKGDGVGAGRGSAHSLESHMVANHEASSRTRCPHILITGTKILRFMKAGTKSIDSRPPSTYHLQRLQQLKMFENLTRQRRQPVSRLFPPVPIPLGRGRRRENSRVYGINSTVAALRKLCLRGIACVLV